MSKPAIPKGTRDFPPQEMAKRNYIFNTIRSVFESCGYLPIETPAMEGLSTLTGKYGEEGDQLIFKILNNGDFLNKADEQALSEKDSKKLSFSISKKALRYDLTVPFARFVVMNHGAIHFPFKRYQIQPVWRGDRPGKGRYQEFFQCDADVVGSDGLLNEVELIQIFDKVFSKLRLPGCKIKINNRKLLAAVAELHDISDKFKDFTIALDKLDKIGLEGVNKEMLNRGFSQKDFDGLAPIFQLNGTPKEKLAQVSALLSKSEVGRKGIEELQYVFEKIKVLGLESAELEFDITLARGLDYYTGAIFEVIVEDASVGSVCGGGRYDDLTGIFGLKGISGVGISFGADRIYDVLDEFNLFPKETFKATDVLIINFGEETLDACLKMLVDIRNAGISAEIFPDAAKLKKQFKYANDKGIPKVISLGSMELAAGEAQLKDMESGEQKSVALSAIVETLIS